LESEKRPVVAYADSRAAGPVTSVEIETEPTIVHKILFDPGHGLEERLITEQFA
jgi:NAD+ kinase